MQVFVTQPSEAPAPTDRVRARPRLHLTPILTLAILCRLSVVWLMLSQFPNDRLFHEAPDLGFLAESLNSGRGLASPFGGSTGPTALVAPGYPAVVALIFHLFGAYTQTSAATVMLVQTLFATLTVAVLMQVADRLFGAHTAHLAGLFWALSIPLLWLPTIFWDTSLSTLLVIGMLALALRAVERPDQRLWLLIGGYGGLVILVNPSLLLAMFAIFGWAAHQSRRQVRYSPLIGLLVLLTIVAPWPIRNAQVLHAFIPLRSSFGYELWQGTGREPMVPLTTRSIPSTTSWSMPSTCPKAKWRTCAKSHGLPRPTSVPTQANLCGSQPCAWRASGSELEER